MAKRFAALALAAAATAPAAADTPPIQVNPNRPTFATPALTTQSGVFELEFGLAHSVLDEGGASSSPFLLKLGLSQRLELRIGGNGLLRVTAPGEPATIGYGDTTVGAQWIYWPKGPLGVDEAVQVTVKLPTADSAAGLGSGKADILLMLLLSRDFGAYHADVNFLTTWLGRPARQSRETQPAGTLSVSRALGEHWSVTGELYSLAKTSQADTVVSNLWAVGYKVSPRLVLDGGVDVGLSHAAPKVSFFAGLTVGVGRFRHSGPALGPRI
jgi:hypothetical protein